MDSKHNNLEKDDSGVRKEGGNLNLSSHDRSLTRDDLTRGNQEMMDVTPTLMEEFVDVEVTRDGDDIGVASNVFSSVGVGAKRKASEACSHAIGRTEESRRSLKKTRITNSQGRTVVGGV